jgi:ankyrin repeat protein
MLAVNNGHYELATHLISKHNANVHFTITDRLGRSTLDLIADSPLTNQTAESELVRLIIRKGQYTSDPDAMESALLQAARNLNIQMCELFVDACDISEQSTASLTRYAATLAVYHCHQPLDRLLSKASLPCSQSSFLVNKAVSLPPVLCWMRYGNEYLATFRSTLKVLRNHGESPTVSTEGIVAPLLKAVTLGHTDFVLELISMGADPLQEEPDFDNASPFTASVGANLSNPEAFEIMLSGLSQPLSSEIAIPLISLASYSRPAGLDCIRALHRGNHIDIALYCGQSSSVLHHIILGGFDVVDIIEYLLNEGAAVDALDKDGKTPIFVAIETQKLGVLQLLLSKGASRTQAGPKGSTPLHTAAAVEDNGEAMTILVGRDITKTDIGVTDGQGYTALHTAAERGNVGALNTLLEVDADSTIKDPNGRTPLDLAREALIDASNVRSSSNARRHKLCCQQIVEILQRRANSSTKISSVVP